MNSRNIFELEKILKKFLNSKKHLIKSLKNLQARKYLEVILGKFGKVSLFAAINALQIFFWRNLRNISFDNKNKFIDWKKMKKLQSAAIP